MLLTFNQEKTDQYRHGLHDNIERDENYMKEIRIAAAMTFIGVALSAVVSVAGCQVESNYPEQPLPTTSPSWSGTNRQIVQLGSYGETVSFACFGPNGVYQGKTTVVVVDDKNCTGR